MTPKEMPSVAPANSKKASMSSVSAWAPRPRPRLGPRLRPPGTPRMRPGELHDLALICFGLALRARGSRIAFLGADSPLDTLMRTAGDLQPDVMSSQPPPRSDSRECVPTCVSWAGRGGSPLPARARHKPSQRRSAPSSSTVTRQPGSPCPGRSQPRMMHGGTITPSVHPHKTGCGLDTVMEAAGIEPASTAVR
jgi:hypothetical protein